MVQALATSATFVRRSRRSSLRALLVLSRDRPYLAQIHGLVVSRGSDRTEQSPDLIELRIQRDGTVIIVMTVTRYPAGLAIICMYLCARVGRWTVPRSQRSFVCRL